MAVGEDRGKHRGTFTHPLIQGFPNYVPRKSHVLWDVKSCSWIEDQIPFLHYQRGGKSLENAMSFVAE